MIGWKSASTDPRIASFRFRVEKPVAALAARGHRAELFQVENLQRYRAMVFAKSYSADDLRLAQAVRANGGAVIFDLCDNHFYNPGKLPRYERARAEMCAMIQVADRVTCSTATLAAAVAEVAEGRTAPLVIGDIAERSNSEALSTERASPFNFLWFGSHGSPNAPGGMADLQILRERLERLALQTPLQLTVCSNSRAKYDEIVAPFALPTRYVEWSIDRQIVELARADAVVLPVTLNPFAACKSHNRLSSALYAGRPVVATAIDSYKEFAPFCTLDDWDDGFRRCVEDPVGEAARAISARSYIDERYSEGVIAPLWEAALDLTPPKAARTRRRPAEAGRYMGRLDAVASGAVTGWVKNLSAPEQVVEVVLECDGETVAAAKADLPRGDLRSSRMPHPDCGFAIPLHDVGIADPASLKIKVAGAGWLVGENPILFTGEHADEIRSANAAPPSSTIERDERPTMTASPASAAAQSQLFEEVRAVEELLSELRRVLARAVVGLGDDPAMAERLQRALGQGAAALRSSPGEAASIPSVPETL